MPINNTIGDESMEKSMEIASRFWNLPQKPFEELNREKNFIDDIIQKTHIEKEIISNLNGVKTVFDGGAGYGRFSILLAKHGLQVTHFDISLPMIDKAREIARNEGVYNNITFIQGSLENLEQFTDTQFDMVLSFDSPISYTYPNQKQTIQELIRICSKRIIIGVYSRLAWTYSFDPGQKIKYILNNETNDPLARWYLDQGSKRVANHRPDMKSIKKFFETGLVEEYEDTISQFEKGETPWPVSYAFMPKELSEIMEMNKMKNIKFSGPGALSRSIPGEVLKNIMNEERLKKEFLEFCYWYDSQPSVAGLGKDNIIVNAER
jgi:ubiquinone/menaquinone biosynthesis C-methylase UbiE